MMSEHSKQNFRIYRNPWNPDGGDIGFRIGRLVVDKIYSHQHRDENIGSSEKKRRRILGI